jgi:hypothetical protein
MRDENLKPNVKALAAWKNIPSKLLYLAKSEGAPGFRSNGNVHWTELEPWFNENRERLQAAIQEEVEESTEVSPQREKLELAKLKEEVRKLQNYNRAKDEDFISRKMVLAANTALSTAITTELRRVFEQEQPIKTQNLPAEKILEINKEYLNKLFSKLQKPLHEWSKADDLEIVEGEESLDANS